MARKSNITAMAVVMQAAAGIFTTPSAATDLYPISNLSYSIQGVTVDNAEYTGSIHRNGPDVAGKTISGSFAINLRPPGGDDVPGADEWVPGRFLKAAKFTELITSDPIPAAPEALGAGSTNSAAVLGAGAAATDGLYKGLALLLPSIAAMPRKQITAIRSYADDKTAGLMETLGAAPAGNYQIPKQLSYVRSVDSTDAPFLSTSLWLDGVRYDLVDFRPTVNFTIPTSTRDGATTPTLQISFTATIQAYEDDATPSIPALGSTPLFKDGKLIFAGQAVGGSDLTVDFGMRTAYPPNPNFTDGSAGGELVESTTSVQMTREAYTKAVLDTLAMADAQTYHSLLAQYGYSSGKFVQLVIPDLRLNYQSPQLGQDFITETGDLYVDVADRNVCLNFPYWA